MTDSKKSKLNLINSILFVLGVGLGLAGNSAAFFAAGINCAVSALYGKDGKAADIVRCVLLAVAVLRGYTSAVTAWTDIGYLSLSPRIWLFLPCSVVIVFYLYLLFSVKEESMDNNSPQTYTTYKNTVFDFFVFIFVTVAVLLTFFADFYSDHIASVCICLAVICRIVSLFTGRQFDGDPVADVSFLMNRASELSFGRVKRVDAVEKDSRISAILYVSPNEGDRPSDVCDSAEFTRKELKHEFDEVRRIGIVFVEREV